jgi:hypothetical protein
LLLADKQFASAQPRQGAIVARGEPQAGVRAELILMKRQFRPLEPIDLTIRFHNEDDAPAAIMSSYIPWTYHWEISDESGKDIPPLSSSWGHGFIGRTSSRLIAPGGELTESVVLNRYFDLTMAGRYWLRILAGRLPAGIESYAELIETGRQSMPIWSGTISFEIEEQEPNRVAEAIKTAVVVSTEHEGIRMEAEVDRQKPSPFEPITLVLRVTNHSGGLLGVSDTKPWITYSLQRTKLSKRARKDDREFLIIPPGPRSVDRTHAASVESLGMSRFGEAHPVCRHRLARPLAPGESHEDRIILNRMLDLMAPGAYQVRVTAKIRRSQTENDTIELSSPPLDLRIEEP